MHDLLLVILCKTLLMKLNGGNAYPWWLAQDVLTKSIDCSTVGVRSPIKVLIKFIVQI